MCYSSSLTARPWAWTVEEMEYVKRASGPQRLVPALAAHTWFQTSVSTHKLAFSLIISLECSLATWSSPYPQTKFTPAPSPSPKSFSSSWILLLYALLNSPPKNCLLVLSQVAHLYQSPQSVFGTLHIPETAWWRPPVTLAESKLMVTLFSSCLLLSSI